MSIDAPNGSGREERSDDHQRAQRATHLMRWRIGLGEDRGLGGSQVESYLDYWPELGVVLGLAGRTDHHLDY